MASADEARMIDRLADRLAEQFPNTPRETVRAIVDAAHAEFADRPIRDFIPIFVERAAHRRLNTAAAVG
jgi:hypothetical protein